MPVEDCLRIKFFFQVFCEPFRLNVGAVFGLPETAPNIDTSRMKKIIFYLFLCLLSGTQLVAQNGQPMDTCQGTWLKLWGKPGTTERGIVLCPAGDGNLYVAGTTPDSALLLKVSPAGNIIWARSFDFFPGYDRISHLSLDSDGMLLGCGNSNTNFAGGGTNSFFFKYIPQGDKFLWVFQPSFFGINARGVGSIKGKVRLI